MSTHVPGLKVPIIFQLFFFIFFVLSKLATSSIRVNPFMAVVAKSTLAILAIFSFMKSISLRMLEGEMCFGNSPSNVLSAFVLFFSYLYKYHRYWRYLSKRSPGMNELNLGFFLRDCHL